MQGSGIFIVKGTNLKESIHSNHPSSKKHNPSIFTNEKDLEPYSDFIKMIVYLVAIRCCNHFYNHHQKFSWKFCHLWIKKITANQQEGPEIQNCSFLHY